mmetsp:Transcript_13590/g.23897  ORF Transcript_13590/g.23897 Transcript_13590/m.23897 type:complete len:352 (-) Transcript_13590:62-1117(-)
MAASVAQNMQVLWKDYVETGLPKPDNFILKEAPMPEVTKDGEIKLNLLYLSVDPYMRGRMRNTPGYFVGPFAPGEPLTSGAVARVVESRNSIYPVGTVIQASLPWVQYTVQLPDPAAPMTVVSEDVAKELGLPLSVYVGALGMTGMTAFCSLERIGKPKKGETVFVSGAAGAVGLIVGQLCKNVYGCTVVGSAGTDAKVEMLLKNGFDSAWNYKTMTTADALAKYTPQGIDVYFDNVGGETLESALAACNLHARVVCCGSISNYNKAAEEHYGVRNMFLIISRRILMEGFIVYDFTDMLQEFITKMTSYLREGKVTAVEQVVKGGLGAAGQAFIDLMQGANTGKMVIKCSE